MVSVADRIKEGMTIRNMKQIDIVEKTGINKGAVSSYISGKYEPKQANISLIANALGVSEAWLMGQSVPMEKQIGTEVAGGELSEYLEVLKNRSDLRMLFQLAKGATKSDVETAVKIIEALQRKEE